ncbi:MAG: hypothetical protein HYR74_09000 [Candidatus Eisenbacteria bacterium]|nr:hypothetical protein [Candidatus Eisenbacteria bacterium]
MFEFLKSLARNRRGAENAAPEQASGNGSAPYYVHTSGSRVDVIEHARAAGRENLPETSAREPNDVENAIRREHERRHRDLVEETRGQIRSLVTEFDRLDRELPSPRDLHAAVQRAEAGLQHDLASDNAVIPRWQGQQRCRRDLRHFAANHNLARPARYPISRLHHFAWLGPLVVLESAANAAFFAGISVWGLAGGFLIAMLVAAINVTIGALAGYFPLRWRGDANATLRRLATAGTLLYGISVILFNWGTACFRDAAAGGVAQLRFDQLLHPERLSLQSAALLLVGIVASLLAARKGFTACDPVPGYGDHDRAFKAAEADFAAARDSLKQRVLSHVEDVPRECRTVVVKAEETIARMSDIIVRLERAIESYEAERERIARWAVQWLTRYRSENQAMRTTPPPRYFTEFPSFPSELDHAPIENLAQRLRAATTHLDGLKDTAHEMEIGQPQRAAAARERFDAFLKDCLRRADHGRGDGSTHDSTDASAEQEAS